MAKMTIEEKKAAMATVGQDFSVIEEASATVQGLRVEMAKKIAPVFKDFGAGPHGMTLPDGSKRIVVFRKDGDAFHVSAVDPAAVE